MKILHLEDSELDHTLAKRALSSAGVACDWVRVDTANHFTHQCEVTAFDLILADYQLPGFTAVDAWHAFPTEQVRPPFVLLSGAIGEAAAVSAIKLGFGDYLSKSEVDRLARVIQRALEFDQNLKAKAEADKALAISKRRLSELNEHLHSITENERKAISREIHDDIGGALAAAKLDIAWILRRDLDAELQGHANAAQCSLQSAIDACRRIMLNLRPSILDDGLQAAVEWLIDGFSRRTGVKVRLRVEHASSALDANLLLVAFRVAQEALTNIAKHAKCTTVSIDISCHEGFLTLEISDNGCGMTREDQLKSQSFGLRGLQERAQSIGGWLDVSSKPGQGTSLVLSVPLDNKEKTQGDRQS